MCLIFPSNRDCNSDLEPLDLWLQSLNTESKQDTTIYDLHVLVAIKITKSENKETQPAIEGGIVFEYHTENNCGLLSYVVVPRRNRNTNMANALVQLAVEGLDRNAKYRGNLAGCNAIFLEAEIAEKATPGKQDVIDPVMRHVLYHKLGFRRVDMEYVMPPVSAEHAPSKQFLLTVYLSQHIPKLPQMQEDQPDTYYLPNPTLTNFIRTTWKNAQNTKRINHYKTHPDYLRMIESIDLRDKIPLLDLPWIANKPWILVDLYEDYDQELLEEFYNDLLVPTFPAPDGKHFP